MKNSEPLSQSIQLGPHTVENRFAINAMECNDADDQGNPGPKTYRRYKNLFEGDAGVIELEAITITDQHVGRKNQLSVLPRNKESLKKFTSELKEVNDNPLFIWQLTHSGELSHPDFSQRVTPKPLPGFGGKLLTGDDVKKIIDQFVRSAKIAHECGADGIDLKLSHGYLGSQILRPYNDREWEYGGSWENRRKFAFELCERVDEEINDPDFLVGSKISLWEGFPGGQGTAGPDTAVMDLSEPLDLIKGLEERGHDYIIVSAGSPSITLALTQPDKKIPRDVYLHHTFQKEVKEVVDPDTVVIGSAYSVLRNGQNNLLGVEKEKKSLSYWGNKNIRDGVVDMVALGRQSLADPKMPAKYLTGRKDDIDWCTACDHCVEFLINQKQVGCATYNDEYVQSYQKMIEEGEEIAEKHT